MLTSSYYVAQPFSIHPHSCLEYELVHKCVFSMSCFEFAMHSSLHILIENLQIPKTYHFYSCRQGAGGKQRENRQTWVCPADSHSPTAAHLTLHPSSKQTNSHTLQLLFSSLSLESSPPSPIIPSSCGHLALTLQTASPQFG